MTKEELEQPTEAAPSEYYWDQHAVHCGNCGIEMITRVGKFHPNQKNNGLSDDGGGEDEALCGRCAGVEMYRLSDRLNELQPEFHQYRERIADLEAQLAERDKAITELKADQHLALIAGNDLACVLPGVGWESLTREEAAERFSVPDIFVWDAWRTIMDISLRKRGKMGYGSAIESLNRWNSRTLGDALAALLLTPQEPGLP